jgi:murein L,D-transpeptidase YcbB/YkuD
MDTRTRLVASGLLAASLASAQAFARGDAADRRTTAPHAWRIPGPDLRSAVAARLREGPPAAVTEDQWRRVRALYARTDDAPIWLDTAGVAASAPGLVRGLADASSHGVILDPARIDSLRAALARVRGAADVSARDVAEADVRLSAAFVTLAEYLLVGQLDPRVVERDWHIAPRRADVDSEIVRRFATTLATTPVDAAVAALAPDDPVYVALREQLAVYRRVVAQGGWPSVPAGPTLRAGDRADPARLSALTRRLAREGYLADTASSADVYDARLADAAARFQARHAMRVDGALSPETVKALDVPAAYRAAQIAVNLERMRWLPHAMQGRHLIVNVPSFRLLLRDGPRTVTSMKVVVGAEYRGRATPVFADSMSYVVFQPYWNVTPSITLDEVIPKQARDPGYLARNDYEVVRGDGDDAPVVDALQLTRDAVRAGRVRVRQRPGRTNALGRAKFIFPNAYNIYLHDTPAKDLFEQDVRAFSHGCIRVENPAELARWVLGRDAARVSDAMATGRPNRYAPLPRKLPVFIIYLTAFTRDGELFFGNDLYARDDALVRRLASAATPAARTARALEALGSLVAR